MACSSYSPDENMGARFLIKRVDHGEVDEYLFLSFDSFFSLGESEWLIIGSRLSPHMETGTYSLIVKGIAAVFICEMAGALGSLFTTPKIATWYQTLILPSFAPPPWVFAPVWITLYFLMGAALFLVLREGQMGIPILGAVSVFAVQLGLNVLWSYLFFGLESPLFGLIGIIILWSAITLTIREFYAITRSSAYLLLPYIIWVTIAGVLNYSIWVLNP
jgi:benzodiazapine receptor